MPNRFRPEGLGDHTEPVRQNEKFGLYGAKPPHESLSVSRPMLDRIVSSNGEA